MTTSAGSVPSPGKKLNLVRRLAFVFNAQFERIADRYPKWLGWALRRRLFVLGAAAASIIAALLIIPRLGFTWMPDADTGEMTVGFRTPPGSSLSYTFGKGREIADFLRKQPDVDFTYLSVGGGGGRGINNGNVYVRLRPKNQRRPLADRPDGILAWHHPRRRRHPAIASPDRQGARDALPDRIDEAFGDESRLLWQGACGREQVAGEAKQDRR